jgi:hypothetical protein
MKTNMTRRDILKAGGLVLLGNVVSGCATETGINPAVPPAAKLIQDPAQTTPTAVSPGSVPPGPRPEVKPTYVAEARDPVAFSLADNLFWNDIMMEHAIFFQMLMPGAELEVPRRQAEEFTRLFAQQVERSRGITAGNYAEFNRTTIDLAKRFSDYKQTMREQQVSGKVRTLVWPLFFTHTAREADRFATRLTLYSKREIEFDRDEVVDFWSKTMGEHSGFIAHLLDPDEDLLIDQATKLEKAFLDNAFRQASGDDVMKAAKEVLDFKTVGEKGIYASKIKSIIPPSLASHVRREAVKFIDELKRAG